MREFIKIIESIKPIAADQKIDRNAFLYLKPKPPKDEFAQCATCAHMVDGKCTLLHATVQPEWSCGLYFHGKPGEDKSSYQDHLTAEDVGLVKQQVRCENCAYGGDKCQLYVALNKALPDMFELDEKIESQACCNAWTEAPKNGDE